MKYLILSFQGMAIFLIPRLNAPDVEKIYFWIADISVDVGDDMENYPNWEKLEIVRDWHKALEESSKEELIIIFDDTGFGYAADYLRKQGWKVIGASSFTDKLEENRTFAGKLMKKFMKVPETYDFTSFRDGFNFLKTQDREDKFVFKPNEAEAPREMTYVSKDVNDLIQAMERFKPKWRWEENFQIQRFIEGIEIDFNAYFNGKEFIKDSMMYVFEYKGLMNDNVGPTTGGAITVQLPRRLEGKFYDILSKVAPYLQKVGYVGQFAANCIISEDDKQPYFLEITPRFGYPSFELEVTMIEEGNKSLHSFFSSLVNGENKSFFQTDKIIVGLSIYKDPYPDRENSAKVNKGLSMSWSKKYDKYFFPRGIKYDKKEGIVLSGDTGDVCTCTCVDSTLDGAVAMVYDTYMKTFKLQDAMYRTDLGKKAKEDMKKLRKWKII